MSEPPRRRLIDRIGASPTFIAEGCRLVGDLETDGPLVVCGRVQGNARIGGAARIAAGAVWEGDVQAHEAVIGGEVSGRIHVAGKVEIGATARIRGEVSARSIAIARGAIIDGNVSVTSGQEVVSFEERRRDG